MSDQIHKKVDKLIEEIEKELSYNYKESLKTMLKEAKKVYRELEFLDEKDEKKRETLIRRSERLKKTIKKLSVELQNVNEISINIIKEGTYTCYSMNHDYGTYLIEAEAGLDTEYNLMNRESVALMLKNEVPVFTEIAYNDIVDLDTIERTLKRELIQSIMLGESINKFAERIKKVTEKNLNDSIRIARTEMTRVQNAGRMDAFKRGEKLGLKLKKRWVSTLDSRTRKSHAEMMNETVGLDEKFSNGLLYPGGNGHPSEVINCRCTHVVEFVGLEKTDKELKLSENIKKMSFERWGDLHG